uniref:Tail assembly chaperone protein n=1 Tax=Siphoviridae sp. ct3fB6 TaxID=2827770 RepID=A0A8S5T7N3_9CAUD|nr:MAG TPA: tail assembly chaperone protein [Siphoviridae sp. ct3fB6]
MKTISLNGKDLSLKYTLRAFFVFESISGYPFQFDENNIT